MDKKALAGKIDKHAISVLANLHCDKNKLFQVCSTSVPSSEQLARASSMLRNLSSPEEVSVVMWKHTSDFYFQVKYLWKYLIIMYVKRPLIKCLSLRKYLYGHALLTPVFSWGKTNTKASGCLTSCKSFLQDYLENFEILIFFVCVCICFCFFGFIRCLF